MRFNSLAAPRRITVHALAGVGVDDNRPMFSTRTCSAARGSRSMERRSLEKSAQLRTVQLQRVVPSASDAPVQVNCGVGSSERTSSRITTTSLGMRAVRAVPLLPVVASARSTRGQHGDAESASAGAAATTKAGVATWIRWSERNRSQRLNGRIGRAIRIAPR